MPFLNFPWCHTTRNLVHYNLSIRVNSILGHVFQMNNRYINQQSHLYEIITKYETTVLFCIQGQLSIEMKILIFSCSAVLLAISACITITACILYSHQPCKKSIQASRDTRAQKQQRVIQSNFLIQFWKKKTKKIYICIVLYT